MKLTEESKDKVDKTANMEEIQAEKKLTDDEVSKATGGAGVDDGEIVSVTPELPGPEGYKYEGFDTADRPLEPQPSSDIQCIRTDSMKSGKTVPDLVYKYPKKWRQ